MEKILVVRVGALGDTLMATPLVAALAEQEPARRIDFLCSAGVAEALKEHPQIEKVIPLKARNWPIALSREKRLLIRQLREKRYDLAFLLESSPRFIDLVGRCGIQEIHSFRDCPFDPLQHASRNHLRVASFEEWREMPLRPFFKSSPEDRRFAQNLLREARLPRVGLHCGYGPASKTAQPDRLKGWRLSNFTTLGSHLLAAGTAIVLTGSTGDLEATRRIASMLPQEQVFNLAGKTSIGELGAVIETLDLFISVDSGPAHLAAIVGTPLIVLWGPAKLTQVRPLQNGAPVIVLQEPVPCAPCYDTPPMKSCRANICMQLIRPLRVAREAMQLLEGTAGNSKTLNS